VIFCAGQGFSPALRWREGSTAMPRYKLTIEYDGRPFHGWQRQESDPSVQQAVEEAIERFAAEPVRLRCAGRTDAGVHATGQVAHVDLAKDWRTDTVRDATNVHLGSAPVTILSAERVGDGFDARLNAVKRHYRYRILDRRAGPALDIGRVWHVPYGLDQAAMAEAARAFLGEHDFTTFRAAECQANSPIRSIDRCEVTRAGAEIVLEVSARSFLHHQVRSMAGALLPVGRGRWGREDIARILAAADRSLCPGLAPPWGLYLARVDYPG
jgi:tRNA pseudouridine38-40 synthase